MAPTAGATDETTRASEDNPGVQLVKTLREQVDDLLQQVSQLNGKLVQSYDRVSDLEDTLHVTSSNLRSSTLKISELEIERAQHLSALNTGLLVEKSSITTELTRLMERVQEETAQRGLAENAKQEIEKDLDDLSANLFNQANTMVAEARFARAMSERKADEAEATLRSTEEVVGALQTQMQSLIEEKDRAEQESQELRQLMGKGKWVPNDSALSPLDMAPKLSTTYLPYQEFLLFNSHLRSIRSSREPPPLIITLIQLAFLSRLQNEDSDPTLRLDFAPSLNFLSRRSIQQAVHAGQLTIEPVASSKLTTDPTLASSILGTPALQDLTCALCGKHIFPPLPNDTSRGRRGLGSQSWASTSRFFKGSAGLLSGSVPSSPSSPDLPPGLPTQTYVFRVALPPAPNQKPSTTYPLCHSGFCLKRLRSACALWHFVRESIVTHVWNEPEAPNAPPPLHPRSSARSVTYPTSENSPAVRGVAGRVGNLWASSFNALGASSRSTSPAPSATTPKAEQAPPATPPRRLPPISTNSPARTSAETAAPVPPLPPRRRPTVSDAKAKNPESTEDNVPQDDAATMRTGAREESGLLTPASESDGFRTPPERAESPTNATSDDGGHEKAVSTELPPSRPDSVIFDVDHAHHDEATTPRPPSTTTTTAEEDTVSTPVAAPSSEPAEPVPAAAPPAAPSAAPSAAAPPPLPRRAAARAAPAPPPSAPPAEAEPVTETEKAPKPASEPEPASEPASEPVSESVSEPVSEPVPESAPEPVPESAPVVEEPEKVAVSEPQPDVTVNSDLTPPTQSTRMERAASIMSDASRYSSEPVDAISKALPPISPPPALPPRRPPTHSKSESQASVPQPDSEPVSWEERTWKELVKLREDMFWARMGGVRTSDEDTTTVSTPV